MNQETEHLRQAMESLMDAKLCDVLARPQAAARLVEQRCTGVASYDVRKAERQLDEVLARVLERSRNRRMTKRTPSYSHSPESFGHGMQRRGTSVASNEAMSQTYKAG